MYTHERKIVYLFKERDRIQTVEPNFKTFVYVHSTDKNVSPVQPSSISLFYMRLVNLWFFFFILLSKSPVFRTSYRYSYTSERAYNSKYCIALVKSPQNIYHIYIYKHNVRGLCERALP